MPVDDRRLRLARDELTAAVERFLEEVERHRTAQEDGGAQDVSGWSAVETTRHLALCFDSATSELRGGRRPRPAARGGKRLLLRWLLLPHILFHRSWPVRLLAAKEHTPGGGALSLEEEMSGLRTAASALTHEAGQLPYRRRVVLNHPHFGSLAIERFLRLAAVHVEHHRRQIGALRRRCAA